MQLFHHDRHHPPVPTGLIAAAIDYILITRPDPAQVQLAAAALAIKLGYDADTAISLSLRISATTRMFADPAWPAIKTLSQSLHLPDNIVFIHAVQRFIAHAPLRSDLAFDIDALARSLTSLLPAHGHA